MKVLITGGAGFIGSNFIFYMREKHPDYQLVCLDKLTYAGNLATLKPVMENPQFKFIRADIDYDRFFETMNSNHLHTVYGSYKEVLRTFCQITGIEFICYND